MPDEPRDPTPDPTTAPTVVPSSATGTLPGLLLQAVRDATAGAYEILGALGADEESAAGGAFLAREIASGELVVLQLAPEEGTEPSEHRFELIELRELDASVPSFGGTCQLCQAPLHGWERRCAACGSDVSGIARDSGSGTSRGALLAAVREAAEGVYEVLGDMPRAEGGGAVYFAREIASQRLVALRLLPDEQQEADEAEAYTLGVTQLLALNPALTPAEKKRAPNARVCPQCGEEFGPDMKFCPTDGVALRALAQSEGLVGQILADRYHIVRKLGEGGMGEVYLGEHVKMGRPCAIKVMRRALADDADAVRRFNREAANASRINHPNIATVYDFGETPDGLVYLAMELVEGEPLSGVLAREGRLAPERVARIGREVADALAAAHDLGIVHRDLKPDNIMVAPGKDGHDVVKVVDFGIAKAMAGGRTSITRTGFVLGTPAYMSPEQITGDTLDGRTDLYSLGCILYELLTGQPTFAGASGEVIINRRLTEPPPRPRKVAEDVPRVLDEIVGKLLARSPAERYQSAAELSEVLAAPIAPATRGWRALVPWITRPTSARTAGAMHPVTQPRAPTVARALVVPTVKPPRPRTGSGERAYVVPQSPAVPAPRRSRGASAGIAPAAAPAGAPGRASVAGASAPRRGRRGVWLGAAGVMVVAAGVALTLAKRRAPAPSAGADSARAAAPTSAPAGSTAGAPDSAAPVAPPLDSLGLQIPATSVGQSISRRLEALAAARRRDSLARARADSIRIAQRAESAARSNAATSPASPTTTPASSTSATRPGAGAAAPAPTTPAPNPASDAQAQVAAVTQVIDQYVQALGAKQVDQMRALYPAMSGREQEGFRLLFQSATDFSATSTGAPSVAVNGTAATADFGYSLSYFLPSVGKQHPTFRWHATLQRGGQGWRIQSLQRAP
jgi:serine/threonine protein kinase